MPYVELWYFLFCVNVSISKAKHSPRKTVRVFVQYLAFSLELSRTLIERYADLLLLMYGEITKLNYPQITFLNMSEKNSRAGRFFLHFIV